MCIRDSFRRDRTVGLDLHHQLVQVGTLLDTGVFHRIADPAHWRERRIQHDAADALGRLVAVAAQIAWHIAAALFDLDLHVQLAALRQVSDDVLGIDDLDIVRRLDVARGDRALALFTQHQCDCLLYTSQGHATGVNGDGVQTVPILCYHRFGSGSSKMLVAPAQFEAQLEWLARNHYKVCLLYTSRCV